MTEERAKKLVDSRAWDIYERRQAEEPRESIARSYQITQSRVDDLYKQVKKILRKPPEWHDGLGTRAVKMCRKLGLKNVEDLRKVYDLGIVLRFPNCGKGVNREVRVFLDKQEKERISSEGEPRKMDRLNKAAPEMLEILKDILPEIQCRCDSAYVDRGIHEGGSLCHYRKAICNAITKAEGSLSDLVDTTTK